MSQLLLKPQRLQRGKANSSLPGIHIVAALQRDRLRQISFYRLKRLDLMELHGRGQFITSFFYYCIFLEKGLWEKRISMKTKIPGNSGVCVVAVHVKQEGEAKEVGQEENQRTCLDPHMRDTQKVTQEKCEEVSASANKHLPSGHCYCFW